MLQGLYFALAVVLSLTAVEQQSCWLSSITWVLFEVSMPIAVLVTVVSTFVLFPAAEKTGTVAVCYLWECSPPHVHSLDLFGQIMRRWPALVMHNLNTVNMVTELLLLPNLRVQPLHLPIAIFFGGIYIVFGWWLYFTKRRTFLYFFLDFRKPLMQVRTPYTLWITVGFSTCVLLLTRFSGNSCRRSVDTWVYYSCWCSSTWRQFGCQV